MDRKGLIGIENRLPWKMPADMAWFRRHTLGKPILMGRKTFESFGGRTLPQRQNIVLTRDHQYSHPGIDVVHSIREAIEVVPDSAEMMVIGGSELYRQMLLRADRLYLTQVEGIFKGDAWFPDVDWSEWQKIESEFGVQDEKNPFNCQFTLFERHSN